MKTGHYKTIFYFILFTIIVTVVIQVYWNVQNYNVNKKRLINEVQISLDNGVEAYYSELAKTDMFAIIGSSTDSVHQNGVWNHSRIDSMFIQIESDTVNIPDRVNGFTQILDSGKGFTAMRSGEVTSVSVLRGRKAADSIQGIKTLANKLIISLIRDTIDFEKLNDRFTAELTRKNLNLQYGMEHLSANDSILNRFNTHNKTYDLSTFSKSTYLSNGEKIQLVFSNPTLAILKRSLTGILLSFLLSGCIIACLLYLLHIIKKQKELAEIKNDLISNITHEFKTPIATVSTAIEGIRNFNELNDPVKTKKYLNISEQQLEKLHLMVEKLLETATLDSDKLLLKKETVDLVFLVKNAVDKYRVLTDAKTLQFTANVKQLNWEADQFHLENAIGNLIDNAIKYGGNIIQVNLNSMLDSVEISVADNGGYIDRTQEHKIFDKFYRVPTGNQHDVKGFGIGLYYTKKIVEKHGGQITLVRSKNNTVFKMRL